MYADSLPLYLPRLVERGVLVYPAGDGKINVVKFCVGKLIGGNSMINFKNTSIKYEDKNVSVEGLTIEIKNFAFIGVTTGRGHSGLINMD